MNPPSFHTRVLDALDKFLFEHEVQVTDMEVRNMDFELRVKARRDDVGIEFEFNLLSANHNHAKQ